MSQIPSSSIWMMVTGIVIFVIMAIPLGIISAFSVSFGTPPVFDAPPDCDVLFLCLNVLGAYLTSAGVTVSYYLGIFFTIATLMGSTVMILITGDIDSDGTMDIPFPFNIMMLAGFSIPVGIGLIQIVKGVI